MTISGTVRLAAIIYQSGFKIDDFLTRLASLLHADQIKVAGVLQENTRDVASFCSAMTLVDLTSRGRFRISQDLGTQAEGCRLDARGIADIAPLLERTLNQDAELIILNRFGKAEAEGNGLRSAFARAMEAGIPTVTAVREPYIEAWSQFHGRLAIDLAPDLDAVLAWCREAVRQRRVTRRSELSPAGRTQDFPMAETEIAAIGIVTVSDRATAGIYRDTSGPAIEEFLREVVTTPWRPVRRLVPDGIDSVRDVLIDLADREKCALIFTTGGTGPAPRDLTPEGTAAACTRMMPGFGELMRMQSLKQVPTAILSRQTAGIRGASLIVNLPGRPTSIRITLQAVFPTIPYCLDLIGAGRIETDPARCKEFRPPQ